MRFRIIPATILTATLLAGVKMADVVRGTESLLIPTVEAQQAADKEAPKGDAPLPAPTPEAADKAATAPDATPPAADAALAPAPKQDEASPFQQPAAPAAADKPKSDTGVQPLAADKPTDAAAPKKEAAKPEDATKKDAAKADDAAKKEAKAEPKAKCSSNSSTKNKDNPNVSDTAGDTTDHRFTTVELELLQSLAKRREELDRWDHNIQIKEVALDATEKRIDDKIGQIEAMKKEVSDLLALYNTQEDAKIKSLVKIYENMKPKDAARIFDEVEMPILLLVIDKMSEKKTAPILAEMNPLKAKQITVQLAEQRRVNTAKLSLPGDPAAPPATAKP